METQTHLIVPALYLFRFNAYRQFPYIYVAPMLTSIRVTSTEESTTYTLMGNETSRCGVPPLSIYGKLSEKSPIFFEKSFRSDATPQLKRNFYDAFIVNAEESNYPGHLEESISNFKFDYFVPTQILTIDEFIRTRIHETHSRTKVRLFFECVKEDLGWEG